MTKKSNRRRVRLPQNFNFWRSTLLCPKDLKQFYIKGDDRQICRILDTLVYLRKTEPELFEEIKGEDWIKKFKEKRNGNN
ncbi:MAG: hypothetical protein M0R03_20260 [Novosphingobium sp.]|nr:hypothetical protein [Novosphingobium sp.]